MISVIVLALYIFFFLCLIGCALYTIRDLNHNIKRQRRVIQKEKMAASYITEIWSESTTKALEFMGQLGLFIGPHFPHRWRRGFYWWHKYCCYGCAQARVVWPLIEKRMRIKFKPLSLPKFPEEKARYWVQKELGESYYPLPAEETVHVL